MRSFSLAALAVVGSVVAGSAQAGPNEGGVLIVHANTGLEVSDAATNYCGQSGLEQCDFAVTTLSGGDAESQHGWFAIAAFPNGSSPRLSGLTFGLHYSGDLVLMCHGACGDYELPTANWPASDEGTAVTWDDAQTSQLVEVYYFVGYSSTPAPAVFQLAPHPTQGAWFVDDSVIDFLDPIAGLGGLGFNTPGSLPCGEGPGGACCLPDSGGCEVLPAEECVLSGGVYQGDSSMCDPDPCVATPSDVRSWGGIKQTYR